MDYPQRHIEQIEVIERSVVESRKPISAEEALNYQPTTETRTTTEYYTKRDGENNDESTSVNRYYLTGEREKDTSIFYNSSSPPPDRSFAGGVNNYGYDLNEVHTSDGGARIVQTHGSGNIFSPDLRSLADYNEGVLPIAAPFDDSSNSFLVHDRSLDASTLLQSAGNSRSLLQSVPLAPPNVSAYRETASREVHRTIEDSPLASSPPRFATDASGIPYTSVTALSTPYSLGTEPLHSILKNSEKRYASSEDNSFNRKDSYRRMQDNQDPTSQPNSFYVPSSSSLTSSKTPIRQWTFASGARQELAATRSNNAIGDAKNILSQLRQLFRDTEWTPRLIGTILLIALLVFLLLLVAWLIFNAFFSGYAQRNFLLYPPICEECARRNPAAVTYRTPSQLFVHLSSPVQAHFELIGNPPFKSNSFTAIDFYTGYIAIADHALTDEIGRHTTCFLMELDRSAVPDMSTLIDALDNTYHEVRSQFGWQEYWQYNAELIDERVAREKFRQDIDDCENAKWYFLKHTVYTKDASCSTCYDFCLPDYAVLRRVKYEDEPSLGIRRLNCFRLYVPEWSRFRIETDESGGHWVYPKAQLEQLRQQQHEKQWQRSPDQASRQQRGEQSSLLSSAEQQQRRHRERYHLVGNWIEAGSN